MPGKSMDRINLFSTAVSLVALAFIVYTCNQDPEEKLATDVGKTLACLKECDGTGKYREGMCICMRDFDQTTIEIVIDDVAGVCYDVSGI